MEQSDWSSQDGAWSPFCINWVRAIVSLIYQSIDNNYDYKIKYRVIHNTLLVHYRQLFISLLLTGFNVKFL